MTVKDFNKIQTMFENELHGNLIKKMRKFISYETSAVNRSIKSFETRSCKVEEIEKHSNRIGAILDFMLSFDIVDIETYRSEYDDLIDWKLKKIREVYH